MNDLSALAQTRPTTSRDSPDPPELALRALSTRDAVPLLSTLLEAIDQACGWVLEHRMVSAHALQIRIEAQGRALMDVYGALVMQGLELSRDSHLRLTERCSCARLSRQARSTIVTLRLEITLPSDVQRLFRWWNTGQA